MYLGFSFELCSFIILRFEFLMAVGRVTLLRGITDIIDVMFLLILVLACVVVCLLV